MTRDQLSLNEIADSAAELSELRTTADDILSHAWTVERTRSLLDGPEPAFDEDLWKTIVELGWPDVLVSEPRGGGGAGTRELCVLTEAAGAVALPVPLASVASAAWCADRCVEGVTLVLEDVGATFSEGGVTGSWPVVSFGAAAERLLVVAHRDGEAILGIVDATGAGVQRQPQQPLDHNPACSILLAGAALLPIGSGSAAAERHGKAVMRSRLATIAEVIGIASAANDAAVEYAKVRNTFGRPIGSRQAIKHRLVDQRSVVEVARALVNRAADACELDHPDAEALVSLAAFWAIDSLRRVPEGATQVFGGIAYTWEHDAHVHLRRAACRTADLGSRSFHRSVVARWLDSRASTTRSP
ncbi:acyl-CoA dehydrogenase [Mycolicibacterium rhodesiae NBB3]|uniref:Acyl-CoA dehydrogenase n=1 Tax=Mycolicibacterium rhodesiae (strain NBB3) TaxID=710685 RepID=G8RGH1_MYCRN|nr:acyl-CoA dehydrogenase family protein [Mycolicibacterium rhodesiae]AEV70740.1 acyl-CoA dehydrogenase [Mycolicibacterium rhodesiae NBB3]